MSRLLLIQSSGDIADKTYASPDVVPDGVIAAFDASGAGVDMSAAGSGLVQFVEGGETPVLTRLIDMDAAKVVKRAYVAPVANVIQFASIPNAPSGGGVFEMKLIDKTEGYEPYPRFPVTLLVEDGETGAQIATRFANAFNNYPALKGSVSASSSTLTFTADFGRIFTYAFDFGSASDPNVTVTNYAEGSGTPDQIADLEQRTFGQFGSYYREVPQPLIPESRVVSGTEYDLFIIQSEGDTDRNINPGMNPNLIYLAIGNGVEDGDGEAYDLDTFFGV